jgi:hypothetical protein
VTSGDAGVWFTVCREGYRLAHVSGLSGSTAPLMGRADLFADVERALAPDEPPSKLVVIAFPGLREYVETANEEVGCAWEAAGLLERLTAQVRQLIPRDARLYNSRAASSRSPRPVTRRRTGQRSRPLSTKRSGRPASAQPSSF